MTETEFSLWEIIMLVCFAASWPVSILKSLRTKNVSGKSEFFLILILLGYISGVIYKIFYNPNFATYVYIFNTLLVAVDLGLYYYYSRKNRPVKS